MKQYIVDAFTNKPFAGNPAAVCVMESWPAEESMMKLAMENNLSETALAEKLPWQQSPKLLPSCEWSNRRFNF